MVSAALHRYTYLRSESSVAGNRLAVQQSPIEPGGAPRRDLLLNGKVGAHRQRQLLPSPRIFIGPGLHNRTGSGIASDVQVGKLNMVRSSVQAFDHNIGRALQFVLQSAFY